MDEYFYLYARKDSEGWKVLQSYQPSHLAPVVHGRWEPRQDAPGFVRCSACRNCNTYDDWVGGKKWSYCPECGAKMDMR